MMDTDSKEIGFNTLKTSGNSVFAHPILYRIAAFKKHEMVRKFEVRPLDYLFRLEVIAHDQNIGKLTEMTEISDVGPSLNTPEELEEARAWFSQQNHIPASWHHYLKTGKYPPFLFEKTSFVNLFNKDTVILFDIYRPPWKPYYTSDVFFYQWLKALGADIKLNNFPAQFPETIYVHNITNLISTYSSKRILDEMKTDSYLIEDVFSSNRKKFRDTPHFKSVLRILEAYNDINTLRNGAIYEIAKLQVYRGDHMYHLKFTFNQAQSQRKY